MGADKALLRFGNETLIERVIRQVGEQVQTIVVAAASTQALPVLLHSVVLVRDSVDYQGPLGGLAAALGALHESVEFVYATSVDAPFLSKGFVDFLLSRLGVHDAVLPCVGGFDHPLAAIYRRDRLEAEVRDRLNAADGDASLRALVACLDVVRVQPADLETIDPGLLTLVNVNGPSDYESATSLYKSLTQETSLLEHE